MVGPGLASVCPTPGLKHWQQGPVSFHLASSTRARLLCFSLPPALCSQPQAAETPLSSTVLRVVEQLCGLNGEVFGPPDTPAGRAALGLVPQVGAQGPACHTPCLPACPTSDRASYTAGIVALAADS